MTPLDPVPSADNPFDARYLRPGAIPYHFLPGQNAAALVARLKSNGWRGQIVGPHGSGKSALVYALIGALKQAERRVVLIELHDGQSHFPKEPRREMAGLDTGDVLIVDGYEQLGRWSRFELRRFCRRKKLALVVTSHASVGFPDLARTAVGWELAGRIVDELSRGRPFQVSDDKIAQLFDRHQGNFREMLFDLYDLYERQA